MRKRNRLSWLSLCLVLSVPLAFASGDAKLPKRVEPSPLAPSLEKALGRLDESPSMLALQAALQQLEQIYPERIRLETYGKSRQGRSLYRLRVLPWDGDLGRASSGQPAVLLVQALDGAPNAIPMLREIAKFAGDINSSTSFESIGYPMPDPDGWVLGSRVEGTQGRVRLDRNFPDGWSPWSAQEGHPGSAPLSEPETRSLAASMVQCRGAVALVLLGGVPRGPQAEAQAGSLRRHAHASLGLAVHDVFAAGEWGRVLQTIEDQRPKLEVRVLSQRRLSQDLHLVDLLVRNQGVDKEPLSGVDLGLTGATCLKLAWASGEGMPHVQLASQTLPDLVGGAQPIHVRLVLRVSDPESLVVHLDSPRVQGVAIPIPMQSQGTGPR